MGTRTYLRLPLGVKVAGQHFCRQSDADLAEFLYRDVFKFVDDLAIVNDTKHNHLWSVLRVLIRLATKGYSAKAKKLAIMPEKYEFLGYISTPHGLEPTKKGIDALKNMPVPDFTQDKLKVQKQIRCF